MERAAEVTSATVDAQEDIHASAAYRRSLAGTMVERALRSAAAVARQEIMPTNFKVNGKPVSVDVAPRTTLADCLRHDLRLTGTHVGCEHGVCGACTVIVDGYAVRSCLMLDRAGRRQQGGDGRGTVATTRRSRRCRLRSASITRCNAASARRA